MVGAVGLEPTTPCSQSRCATRLRYAPNVLHGADGGNRTRDLFLTKEVLYRLSHISTMEIRMAR